MMELKQLCKTLEREIEALKFAYRNRSEKDFMEAVNHRMVSLADIKTMKTHDESKKGHHTFVVLGCKIKEDHTSIVVPVVYAQFTN